MPCFSMKEAIRSGPIVFVRMLTRHCRRKSFSVLLLTSKGAAGVTGSGFIVLAATLSAVGHVPVAGLALILGIDRFMSEARALTNMIGNGIACVVVGHWCREVDNDKLKVMMHSKKKYHENEDAS